MSEQSENPTVEDGGDQAPDPREAELDVYPLQERSEDPRWAVGIVWTWVSIAIFLIIFILTLFVLGLWYD